MTFRTANAIVMEGVFTYNKTTMLHYVRMTAAPLLAKFEVIKEKSQ